MILFSYIEKQCLIIKAVLLSEFDAFYFQFPTFVFPSTPKMTLLPFATRFPEDILNP